MRPGAVGRRAVHYSRAGPTDLSAALDVGTGLFIP